MKKRNLKSLKLNKKSISNLTSKNIKGGLTETCATPALIVASWLLDCGAQTDNCTYEGKTCNCDVA